MCSLSTSFDLIVVAVDCVVSRTVIWLFMRDTETCVRN